jgi:hypothetical protein
MDVLGEEGCRVSCGEATIFQDEEGWKMMLEGFMEPWKPGQTLEEARTSIRENNSACVRVRLRLIKNLNLIGGAHTQVYL